MLNCCSSDFDTCDCSCHEGEAIMHCFPCCEECEHCETNITYGLLEKHIKNCKQNKESIVNEKC